MKTDKIRFGTLAGGIVFVLIVGALVYVIQVPPPVTVQVAQISIGSFQETIRADGVLRSKERYTVPAFADGDIKRVSLQVGDSIRKGDKITALNWDAKYDPVRAPMSGVVSKVYRESAGPIRRGEPIVEIIDPSKLELMVELLTTDAVRLRPGSEASIENWSGGEPITAKVTRVSKAGFVKQSALGVDEERTEVVADLLPPLPPIFENVGSNFHADVIFKISETRDALKLPVGSLFRDGSNWAVYIAENGHARKAIVEVNALGTQEASIKSGVTAGQEVLVYPGDLVKEGSRIRVDRGNH